MGLPRGHRSLGWKGQGGQNVPEESERGEREMGVHASHLP